MNRLKQMFNNCAKDGLSLILGLVLMLPGIVTAKESYSFAVVPQYSASETYRVWQPIISYLNKHLPFSLQLETTPDIESFEKQCQRGIFDFAFVNPYHTLWLHETLGYVPVLTDMQSQLNGVIVSRKGAGISQVEQLAGMQLVFPSPNSLGASMMIRRDLTERFQLSFYPRYVKSHSSVYLNVALGMAEAGGGVQKTLERQPAHIRDKLQVIYRTENFPSHPIIVHPRVPTVIRETVVAELLKLSQNDEFRALLRNVPVNQLGPVSFSDYQSLLQSGLEAYYEEQH